ncbi:hypothetical protein E4T66_17195 [Sinimarinibacterium sp. CAU 1509]|uniref:hypothetical protein n=1 Tax=Sinimarinibacterium sp. CAU 1509 TaxID=2562283 RepID=UPI0010ACC78C|nr:hypothetical protein [Sinimarinibacterium sp. CAU 1509]TJY57147.1 hypothetical protein E4T66_17195 [Sinimarinibacterium sp. CAU 1509]
MQTEFAIFPDVADGVDGAPEPSDSLPPLVLHLIDSWPTLVRAIGTAEATVAGLNSQAQALGGGRSTFDWDPLHQQSLHSLTRSAFESIGEYARKVLCAGDETVLSPHTADELVRAFFGRGSDTAPDFAGYWDALEARYGNGAGVRLAHRAAAKKLRLELGLVRYPHSRMAAPKMERGGVTFELCRSVLEPRIVRQGYQLAYQAVRGLCETVAALGLLTDGRFPTDAHVAAFRGSTLEGDTAPVRADIGGCRWIFTKNCTRVWMPLELALLVRESIESIVPADTPLD